MRVSQQMLFDRYVFNLNSSLTSLMDLNVKAQTQKQINKPSDDPTGFTRILTHRDTLRSIEQYKENISTAKGWLGNADEALTQVSTLLTRAKELATQASTGTLDANNREQISYELRSLFEQMVGLANTKFEGKTIFSGHKIDGPAFEEIMWLTTNDDSFADTDFTVHGSSKETVLVQFLDQSGTLNPGDNMRLSNAGVRYSIDGGDTWLTDGAITFDSSTNRASLSLPQSGSSVTFHSDAQVKANDPNDTANADGTWMWIRPSARYVGDDSDAPPEVDKLGAGSSGVKASATGDFLSGNVTVRIDNDSNVQLDGEIKYSYSLNGGVTWVTGNVADADTTASSATLSVANGGLLTITSNSGNTLQPGQQFVIRPNTADLELDISATERVRMNDVGKDIFGGIYMESDNVLSGGGSILTLGSDNAHRVFHSNGAPNMAVSIQGDDEYSKNLFEVMGNLIAFAETNNQTGVQQCLANLKEVQEQVLNKAADVGGRRNRLTTGESIVEGLEYNEKSLLSAIEDADVTELMTDLAQQQIVYESVLRSTSMIMNMNLGKFI